MTKPSRAVALLFLLLSCLTASGGERAAIIKDVNAIASPGIPGTVCVLAEGAFVVADGPTGAGASAQRQAVIAAARLDGKTTGGAVLFGHDGYFDPAALAKADTTPLLLNLIKWAAAGRDKPRVGVIDLPQLAEYLKGKGVAASPLPRGGGQWRAKLADHAVVFFPLNLPKDDADAAAIRRYLDGGGAAFMAGTGWGWLQTHPGHTLAEHPTNRLLAESFGLALGDGIIERDRRTGTLPITRDESSPPSPMLNAKAALELLITTAAGKPNAQLSKDRKADLAQAAQTLMFACRALPAESPLMKRLQALAAQRTDLPLPSPAKPLRQADGLSRVLLTLKLLEAEQTPIDQLKANPAAKAFPGEVPASAPHVTRTILIDPRIPRWHSTGLYAAPGEMITVTLPAAAAGRKLRLRIGAHTDRTYHLAAWHRAPEISREFKLDQPEIRAANAFGGLIYIEVPEGPGAAPPPADAQPLQVTIAHAVRAPYFVLGKTTPQQWRDTLRSAPAPWGELATDKLILTIRSDVLRALDDPTPVLEHWNKVMDATAILAGWPLSRKSPERIVPDADISAGYMHSGYPIMTGLDVIPAMVDLAKLRTVNGGWGFYHEIGHNHQNPDWTFAGTTEVTVNLFTMHTLETVCGVSKEDATRRALVEPAARIKKYLAHPDFAAWQTDPFLALAMYAQLRMEFGWEPFKQVFAEYRALKPDERPKTEEQKHDQWMIRMSKATGKNLGPFFQAWGIPTSEPARKSIEDLPTWTPEGMTR
jgi:hypothetical protein